MTTQTYAVHGITCASCAAIIQRLLKKVDGVVSVEVNVATEQATVTFDESKTNLETMNAAIGGHGYSFMTSGDHASMGHDDEHSGGHQHMETGPPGELRAKRETELKTLQPKVRFAFPIAAFVFVYMIAELIMRATGMESPIPMRWWNAAQFIVATPILFWSGAPFLAGVGRFIRHGGADMNTLVGIGTLVAYLYSSFIFLFPEARETLGVPEALYFDATIVVIGFVLFGKYLEIRSKIKTGEAIEALMKLQATTAHVKRNGQIIDIPLSEVKVGDVCIVKAGEKIPVDGTITEGSTHVDESMMTGESKPVKRGVGDAVIGSTMNTEGIITITAKHVGGDTVLAQIIRLVQNAQGSKAPIQRFADLISAYFVPTVLVIAMIAFIVWLALGSLPFAIQALVGILVIACPCALGLATPTAIIVGTGSAARKGILIKNAESLEIAHNVNTIIFDKTGTLTQGKPTVTDIKPVNGSRWTSEQLLQYAASLEQYSEHPLGVAITNSAKERGCPTQEATEVQVIRGAGIEGRLNGNMWRIGTRALLETHAISLPKPLLETASALTAEAKTVVYIAEGQHAVGVLALADAVKPNAKKTIESLQRFGMNVYMLTGDNDTTAQAIGRSVGLEPAFVLAEVKPDQKAAHVKTLQEKGNRVAMVGDGINDAPALAQADIGIAMSTGTDVAMESADITLLHGDIRKVLTALQLSRHTIRIIKQNLFWAFFYNVVGIPVAAGVFYPFFGVMLNPAFAGLAMALSSVSVLTNSLRLRQ